MSRHQAATEVWGAGVGWQPLAVAGAVALVAAVAAIALAGRRTRRADGPEAMTFDAARQAWAAGGLGRPPLAARRWSAVAGVAVLVGVAALGLAGAVLRADHASATVADVRPQAGTVPSGAPTSTPTVAVVVPKAAPAVLPSTLAADGGLTEMTDGQSRQTASDIVTATEQGSSQIGSDHVALYALAGTDTAAAVVEVGALTTPQPAQGFVTSVLGMGGAKASDVTSVETGTASLVVACGSEGQNGVCSWSTGTVFGLMVYYATSNVQVNGDLTLRIIGELAAR